MPVGKDSFGGTPVTPQPRGSNTIMASNDETASTDVARTVTSLTSEDYASISSFDDALRLVGEKLGGEVVDASDLGDGFSVLDKAAKKTLIGVPFLVLSVSFHDGDYKDEDGNFTQFASLRIVTRDGRKLVLNDGGTGIPEQIKTLWKMRPQTTGKPILVHKGLRVSEYDHPTHGKSETFYLDTSASQ